MHNHCLQAFMYINSHIVTFSVLVILYWLYLTRQITIIKLVHILMFHVLQAVIHGRNVISLCTHISEEVLLLSAHLTRP